MDSVHLKACARPRYSRHVPFPPKIDRDQILAAALAQTASGGAQQLSIRSLAAALNVVPNALYRYFRDLSELQDAVSAAVTDQLHDRLVTVLGRKGPEAALRALALAYVDFARTEPGLYDAFMNARVVSPISMQAHDRLWQLVVTRVTALTGQRQASKAAVSLWALLHGFVALEAICALQQEQKPRSGLEYGLQAWLAYARQSVPNDPA